MTRWFVGIMFLGIVCTANAEQTWRRSIIVFEEGSPTRVCISINPNMPAVFWCGVAPDEGETCIVEKSGVNLYMRCSSI